MGMCSHCYNYGHNKRGCPERKKEVQRLIEEGKTNSWRVREQEAYDKVKKERRCSYCRTIGHTRRTCGTLKDHKGRYTVVNSVFRKALLEDMKKKGLGIGSLIKKKVSYWDGSDRVTQQAVFMITGIDWDEVTWHEALNPYEETFLFKGETLQVLPGLSNPVKEKLMYPPSALFPEKYRWTNNRITYEIVAPVSASAVEVTAPDGWRQACLFGSCAEINEKDFAKCTFESWEFSLNAARQDGFDYLPKL